jgi:crotonobetainyl-CoA:carnitine CoA-transferase CaiB-like acyl-CoA transferase
MTQMTTGALAGLRVLDLSILLAAPQVSAMLADFGADVVKVESPQGDPLRHLGPTRGGRTAMADLTIRSKRVLTLDLETASGQDDVHRLIRVADVIVVNQPPALLARWGCTYDEARALNPALVYVSVSCYGLHGPYADRIGNGSLAEAYGGLTNLIGDQDGPPMLPSVAVGDSLVAIAGLVGTLVACYARDVNGASGQLVDVTMFEPILSLIGPSLAAWDPGEPPPSRNGSRVAGGIPRNVYRTADDGWIALSATTDQQATRVLSLIGRHSAADLARFAKSADRLRHGDELDELVATWVATRSRAVVLSELTAQRIPAAPVNDFVALAEDPHVQARGSLRPTYGVDGRAVLIPPALAQLSRTPAAVGWLGDDAPLAEVAGILATWTRAAP